MNFYSLLPLLAFTSSLCLLFFVIGRNVKTATQCSLIQFLVPLCAWAGLDFILWNSSHLSDETIVLLYRLQVPFYMLIGPYSFRFVYTLLDKEKGFWYKYITWPSWLITIIGMTTDFMTKGHNPTSWGVMHEAGAGFVPAILIGSFVPGYISIVHLYYGVRKAPNKVIFHQRLLILIAILFVPSVSILTNIILPWLLGHKTIIQLGSLTVSINAIIFHVAISKYGLLPISVERIINELFNRSDYGVIIVNQFNQIVEINSAAEQLLDTEAKLLHHSSINDIWGKYFQENHSNQNFEYSLNRDGHELYLKVEQSPYIEKNKVLGSIYTIKDITVEKHAEEAILTANKVLETRVAKRTKALEESKQKLIEQKNELERISRYKSEFIANLSHEIRTPLNGIVGFSELIAMDQDLSHQHHEQIRHIKSCTDTLLDLINSILDYSKIEAKKMKLKYNEVDLSEIIAQSALNCRQKLDQAKEDIELIINDSELQHQYFTDPLRLAQVFNNLISNAAKFTTRGFIKIDVELSKKHEGKDSFRFSVTDTGKGVSQEEGLRVFELFEQGDGSSTRRYGGTGLGLNITKQILQLMGGNLELTHFGKIDGVGACFTFDLTLQRGQEKEQLLLNDEKFVYIDPSPDARNSFFKQISQTQSSIFLYASIADFEKKHSQKPTCLIVEESALRSIHGLKFSEKWQQEQELNFIITFKNHQTRIANQLKSLSAEHFLCKPIILSDLATVLKKDQVAKIDLKKSEEQQAKLKILMAEDNELNQIMQKTILEKHNYEVTVAENGQIACDYIQKQQYDLILMDMQMPVLSGIDATKKIRQMGYTQAIIAMTANAYEEDCRTCLEAGMDSFLSKPLEIKTLIEEIERFHSK